MNSNIHSLKQCLLLLPGELYSGKDLEKGIAHRGEENIWRHNAAILSHYLKLVLILRTGSQHLQEGTNFISYLDF